MSKYKDYIQSLKEKYIGKKLRYKGGIYNIVNIDYNGLILIDLPNRKHKNTPVYLSYEVDRDIL